MDKAKGKNGFRNGLVSLLGATIVTLSPNSRAEETNSLYHAGVAAYHGSASAFVGTGYLPFSETGKPHIQADAYLGKNVSGNVGLVFRQDTKGYSGLGANAFLDFSSEGASGSVGLEKFTDKNQFFANAYFGGEATGAEVGVVRDLVSRENLLVRGLVGASFLTGGEESSAGVRAGVRLNVPLNEYFDLIAEADLCSDERLGNYSVKAGIQYPSQKGSRVLRPVERVSPYIEKEEEPTYPAEEVTPYYPKKKGGLTGGDGDGGPTGDGGLTGGDGDGNPVGNSGNLSGGDGASVGS